MGFWSKEEEIVKMALTKVLLGVSVGLFAIWYITTKTDYWWVALLFIAIVIISAILSWRKATKSANSSSKG